MHEQGLPVWGEVELAYRSMVKDDVLAITGTNGKTTTTALLGRDHEGCRGICICSWKYRNSLYTEAVVNERQILTISSRDQQLSAGDYRRLRTEQSAAILNITPDHLNRHHTMEEYIRVKELIVKNQTADNYCVLEL